MNPCPQGRYFTCQGLVYPFDEVREKKWRCDPTIRYIVQRDVDIEDLPILFNPSFRRHHVHETDIILLKQYLSGELGHAVSRANM